MIAQHRHQFAHWPFPCDETTGCVTTRQIMEQDFPILAVIHDREGTWQVLCETTENPADGMLVCLGCLYQRFPEIGRWAGLERGHEAVRATATAAWSVHETEYGEG